MGRREAVIVAPDCREHFTANGATCLCRTVFGAASVFFSIRPVHALLSDLNPSLVSAYESIRSNPDGVSRALREHIKADSATYYYDVRNDFNRAAVSANQAARFIYLNRTYFNGVYRVNTKGVFNVPYGFKPKPRFPSKSALRNCADAMSKVSLHAKCYTEVLQSLPRRSFVFLDPPYPKLDATVTERIWWPGYMLDEDEAIVTIAANAFEKVIGHKPEIGVKDAGTDASWGS